MTERFTFLDVFLKHGIKPKGVIHVGAHLAQELEMYNRLQVSRVCWVEANPALIPRLTAIVNGAQGHMVINALISNESGRKRQFYVTNNEGQSASYLQLGGHKKSHPDIVVDNIIELTTKTLPEVVGDIGAYDTLNFDIQGAELDALKGMESHLSNINQIYLEVNKEEVYKGCGLISDIDTYLATRGFKRVETFFWPPPHEYGEALYVRTRSDVSLHSLGSVFGTDKSTSGVLPFYEKYMKPFRNAPINILEIGVFFGASIRMWREYFPCATVYGIDHFKGVQGNGSTFDCSRKFLEDSKGVDRVRLIECDQSNRTALISLRDRFTQDGVQFQFIIDDGSHLMKDQQQSLGTLWSCLANGGVYFMEDWPSSLDPRYKDVKPDRSNTTYTLMNNWNEKKEWRSEYMDDKQMNDMLKTLSHPIELFRNNGAGTAALLKWPGK
jgi:FkbM family methyltransferase